MATDAFVLDQAGLDRIMRVVRQVEASQLEPIGSVPDIQRVADTRLYQVGKSIGPQESTVFTGNRWADTASTEFPTIALPSFATIDWFKWGSQKAMPSIAFRPIPHHQWVNYQPPAARWGIITAAVTTRTSSTDCDSVTIDPTTGCDGSGRESAKNWRVELPNRTGGAPALTTGEVLGYMPVNTGQLVAVSDYSSPASNNIEWGFVTGAISTGAASSDCDTVPVDSVINCNGDGRDTLDNQTIILPRRDGVAPSLSTGDVIGYLPSEDGNLSVVSDYSEASAATHWGKATANWTDNGTSCDHVTVQKCDDCEGANAAGGTLTVLLPKNVGDADGMDPNVVLNAVISYTTASDGSLVASSDYLDDKIGTVKMWAADSGGTIPPGWAAMDGSGNSAGNGGTGINMSGKFVRHGAPGGEGGSLKHTHDLFVVVNASLGAAVSAIFTAGVTVDDHTIKDLLHVHSLFPDTSKLEGTGASFTVQAQTELCTGNPVAGTHTALSDPCPSGEWGPLEHGVNVYIDGSAYANAYIDAFADSYIEEASHLPPYKTLIFIERIDNSA